MFGLGFEAEAAGISIDRNRMLSPEWMETKSRILEKRKGADQLLRTPGEIKLEVQDEGQGLNQGTPVKIASGETSGVGLRGMRERLKQLGGSLEIHSNGNGTTVTAALPDRESVPTIANAALGDLESRDVVSGPTGDLSNTTVLQRSRNHARK